MNSKKQRDRGRILTSDGLSRLQQAIRAWELEHEVRCTQERIRELTSAVKEGGLDPGTIRKILKAKEGVDPESIRCLFTTFGLQLDEVDLVSSSRHQIQADPNFVGREGAIEDLNTLINRGAKVIVIQARGGVGKTTLARKYLQQEFGSYLEFPIAKETKDIASIESLIEEKLRQLGEEPGREFFVSLDRLKRKLQDERMGILIDNLEPALDVAGKLIEPHRRYVELLRVLADPAVQSITLITSRERLNEYSISTHHYLLQELSLAAWEQFFQNRFSSEGEIFANESSTLDALYKAYGGNAKAMDILCGTILTDYAGKIEAYWQANQDDLLIERALEDLVVEQFDRLQKIDPVVYKLLCRMGCYRYQDVPTVPIEGITSLLWDVPTVQHRRIIKTLQDRALVNFNNDKYFLHPVLRGEAISRLRQDGDWKRTNQEAAAFWTRSIKVVMSLEDLLQALEASFHYVEIEDFEAACRVLIQERENRWAASSTLSGFLGNVLFFFGALQKMLAITDPLIRNVESGYPIAMLHSTLGDMYYATGNIRKALECYKKSGEIATTIEDKFAELASLTNQGLCRVALLEFEVAQELLNIPAFYESTDWYNSREDRFVVIASSVLAFVKSCMDSPEEAISLADRIHKQISITPLGVQGIAYRLLFLGATYKNLSMFERSREIYSQALSFSQESQYKQLRAKAWIGLAELYREQQDDQKSCLYLLKAINLLREVGAKFDLAEAHYQLGLTKNKMKKLEKSNTNFRKALQLFNEIGAPRQVERVRRSMLTNVDD